MNPRVVFLIILAAFATLATPPAAPARAADATVAGGAVAGTPAATDPGDPPAAQVERKEIEKHVNCTCEDNCGKLLANCICGFSGSMRKEIDAMIGAGMTKAEVFEALVKRYGSRVLASPGSSNWLDRVAWAGPFVALIAGALLFLRVIRRLVAKPAGEGTASPPEPAAGGASETPPPTGYEQKLDDELSRFES